MMQMSQTHSRSTWLIALLLLSTAAAAAVTGYSSGNEGGSTRYCYLQHQCHCCCCNSNSNSSSSSSNSSSSGERAKRKVNLSETEFLKELVSHRVYDPNFRALPSDRGATRVRVSLSVDSFGPVDALNMEYSMEAVLLMRWQDLRLQFDDFPRPLVLSQIADAVWKPGVFFQNAKDIQRHQVPARNILLWLWPNGTLQYNQKLNIKFHCHMNLKDFPFDTQRCWMILSIFEMSDEDLVLYWAPSAIEFTDDSSVFLNEFFPPVVNISQGSSAQPVTGSNFSFLSASFALKRKHHYYLITSYLPSVLVVLLTWSSFAIDFRSAPARVSLCILSLLALLTESAAVESKLPRVSYVTKLGIWHLACIVFIHFTLIEYMLINILIVIGNRCKKQQFEIGTSQLQSQQQPHLQHQQLLLRRLSRDTQELMPRGRQASMSRCENFLSRVRPAQLDCICLFLYPAAFGLFNLVYWLLLLP